jgi:hypothetical protein
MKKHVVHSLSACILGLFSLSSYAADDIYKVSLIIFQDATANAINSEVWPNNPQQPKTINALNLAPANSINNNLVQSLGAANSPYYRTLPTNQFGLSNALARMQKSGKYTIITTVSWLQPLTPSKQAKTIHIFGGKAYDQHGNEIEINSPNLIPQESAQDNSNNNLPPNKATSSNSDLVNTQKPIKWQVNGTIKVWKSQYITLAADFLLYESVPVINTDNPDNSLQTKLMSFPLSQTVRTRGSEIHYLDNPVYGILVYIAKND